MKKTLKVRENWFAVMENNYGTPEISLVRGKGMYVWDEDGKKYLDFLGGIATNILGHAHPKVVKAVSDQIAKLGHVSNLYMHASAVELAQKLQRHVGTESRVFFCNSGAEANEAALKISRLTGRRHVISTQGAFHGRTMGALSLTGQPDKRRPFIPLLRGVKFLPYGDIRAMRRNINSRTAMVIIEPIQGEKGVVQPPAGYLKEIRDLCTQHGVLMCVDAVQTGMGRTGTFFGFEKEGIIPDIITLAKGIGGGLPLGAMITVGESVPHFQPGQHGSTFGGNPVSVRAGLATLEVIEREKLSKNALAMSKKIRKAMLQLDGVESVRGEGLLLGIVLKDEIAKRVSVAASTLGLLVNAPNNKVIRIAPPLITKDVHVAEFARKFTQALEIATKESRES